MKLNCPVCSVLLNLDDNLAKKLVRCPKCEQSFVVPQVAPPIIAGKQIAPTAPPPDEFELSPPSREEAVVPTTANPADLKFCPGCGAPWKKGVIECNACHYVPALGAKIKPKKKERFNPLNFDLGYITWALFAGAFGYCFWYVYSHWNALMSSIRSMFPN